MQTPTLWQGFWLKGCMGVLGLLGLLASAQAQPTPLTACGTISTSGAYSVQNNLEATGADCLSIGASYVTISLGGYTITGDGSNFSGVVCTAGFQGADVRNGTVTGFGAAGVNLDQCPNSRVSGVSAITNNVGIQVGNNSDVGGSLALNNTAQGVLLSGTSASVTSTLSNGNDVGISSAACPNLITSNVATGNGTSNLSVGTGECVTEDNVAP
jgi:hypothetical protein